MVKMNKKLFSVFFIIFSLLLNGCQWGHVKYYPDETASAVLKDNSICFSIPDSCDYYPAFISINPRNTPSKEKTIINKPDIKIVDGQLCIPPHIYDFPAISPVPYIVELILQAKHKRPRNFVMGFDLDEHRVNNIHLTDMEITKPYNEMDNQ